jgi:hypothetical protein
MEDTAQPDTDHDTSTALVEVSPGTVLLFGDVPEGLDLIPFSLIAPADRVALSDAVTRGTGVLNAGAQVAPALAQAQGLVQLATETLAALQAGATPIQSGGYNLGTLALNGKFAATVRWLPATGATAAGVAAAMGPALAMIAIQAQLHSIANLTRENLHLTETLLDTVRQEHWAELKGLERAVSRAINEVETIGGVPLSVWENVAGRDADLEKQRDHFHAAVRGHVKRLAKAQAPQDRRQYLEKHGEAILMDVHSLLVAHKAWFQYQALRAAVARQRADADELEARLAENLPASVRREYDNVATEMATLLDAVLREAWILAELPGRRTLPFTGARRSAREVTRMAKPLSDAVARLAGAVGHSDPEPVPPPQALCLTSSDGLDLTLRILRWHLSRGETVDCLAHAREHGVGDLLIAVTNHRVLVANASEFGKRGIVAREIPNEDIRFVRFHPEKEFEGPKPLERFAGGARIDLITKDFDLAWTFPRSFDPDHPVETFVALLMDRMSLPETEREAFRHFLPRPALTEHP